MTSKAGKGVRARQGFEIFLMTNKEKSSASGN